MYIEWHIWGNVPCFFKLHWGHIGHWSWFPCLNTQSIWFLTKQKPIILSIITFNLHCRLSWWWNCCRGQTKNVWLKKIYVKFKYQLNNLIYIYIYTCCFFLLCWTLVLLFFSSYLSFSKLYIQKERGSI